MFRERGAGIMEFKLEDKECNVLSQAIGPIVIKQQEIDKDTKIIITQEENLYFEKGFLKEDVKEAIKEETDLLYEFNLGNIGWTDFLLRRINIFGKGLSSEVEE